MAPDQLNLVVSCTPHQRQRWMTELVYPGLPTYAVAWHRPHGVEFPQLATWWTEFCATQPLTSVRMIDERPLPRWSWSASCASPITQISPRDLDLPDALAHARARPWNMVQAPGLRASLVESKQQTAFLVEVHPLIADEQTFATMIQAFLRVVAGQRNEEAPGAAEQRNDLCAAFTQVEQPTLVEHWRTYLAGAPTVVDLPWNTARPASPSAFMRSVVPLGAAAAAALQASTAVTATPSLLIAAVAAVCARITGQDDVVLGCQQVDPSSQCGPFGSVWPIRIDLRDDPRGDDLLALSVQATNHIIHHRQIPLATIIETTASASRQEHPPLFQILVGREPSLTSSIMGKPQVIDPLAAPHYLAFLVTESNCLAVYANRDLVSSELAQRIAAQVVAACEALAHQPTTRLSALPLQSASDEAAMRARSGPIKRFSDGPCLHKLVSQQATLHPHAIALSMDGRSVTYAELERRANQLARHLIIRGVAPEVLVGHCLRRTIDAVVAILAILKAGGAYVPLDPAHPAERLLATVIDAGTPVIVCESALAEHFRNAPAVLVLVDDDATSIAGHSDLPVPSAASPEHLAYVIYTSGSTGRPKGVPITHAQIVRLFSATQAWFTFTERDVWTLFHSLAFDFSVWELWGALLYGGRLVLVDELVQRSPADFHALIRREGVTILNQTPAAFYQFARADEEMNASTALRLVIFGGEKLEPTALGRWFDRHGDHSPQLVNMYGITETTVHVTYRPLSKADLARTGVSPIGVPIPDLSLYLLDRALRPVPVGVIGELFIGGAGVGRGYLNRPELTAERFIADPFCPGQRLYRSGDAARRLPDGEIDYVGRLDQQVKIRGYRIELGEIDAVIRRNSVVADCAVTVHQPSATVADRSLVAYVVLRKEDAPQDEIIAALRHAAKAALPSHMVPAAFVVLDYLPLTVNGKLDRRALPAPTIQTLNTGTPFSAPSTAYEHAISKAWSQVLGSERISIDDNFFDVGGNSLRLIQVQGLLEQQLARAIAVVDLFQFPTIRALGRQLTDADGGRVSTSSHQATLERARRQQQAVAARRRPERPT